MALNKKRRELTNDICEVLLGRLTPANNQPKKKKKKAAREADYCSFAMH